MSVQSVIHLLAQNNLPFGDQASAANELVTLHGWVIKALCPECARGLSPDRNGEHIFEVIQGTASWTRICRAVAFRKMIGEL